MIAPMKPVAVVMPGHRKESGLRRLAGLGVVHLRARPSLEEPSRDLIATKAAIREMESTGNAEEKCAAALEAGPPAELVERVNALGRERQSLSAGIADLDAELERLRPLGEFDPASLDALSENGIPLRLYKGASRERPGTFPWREVGRVGAAWIVASTAPPEEMPAGWAVFAIPEVSPAGLREERKRVQRRLNAVTEELRALRPAIDRLRREARLLEERHAFHLALTGMKTEGPLTWLEGYCPESELPALRALAERSGWALADRDLDREDEPPTLLRHRPWVDNINPVYQLINSLPGYREADVSAWFLVYFTVFFAILIGDAGYGLLMLGTAGIFRVKTGLKGPVFGLLMTLGAATTVWGALSGNWFGIEALTGAPLLRSLIVPGFDAWKTTSQDSVMALCFLIGATHLSAAHLIVAFRNRRSLTALAHLGWASILWGTWFVVRYLVLGVAISPLMMPLLVAGVALVIAFTAPQKNILKGVALGAGQLPLKLMNGFADLISYIRLFAVGMATLAVAASFNGIAGDVAESGGLFGWILAAVVILFGHGINLIMAALSVIVHGVRLNMMEFSSHAELTWSGTEYAPLILNPEPENGARISSEMVT